MGALDDLTEHLERVFDTWVGPGNFVRYPLVTHVGAVQAEVDLVNPVRGWPAAGGPASHAHRPGIFTTAGDLVREGNQTIPVRGNGIAIGLKLLGIIPDGALAVGLR